MEDVLKLVFVGQDLDDCPQESPVDILNKLLAVDVVDFLRVFQAENRGDYVWEDLRVHLLEKLIGVGIQVLGLVSAQVVKVERNTLRPKS